MFLCHNYNLSGHGYGEDIAIAVPLFTAGGLTNAATGFRLLPLARALFTRSEARGGPLSVGYEIDSRQIAEANVDDASPLWSAAVELTKV